MKPLALLTTGMFLAALGVSAHAQQKPSQADVNAIKQLADANMTEVQAGKVALEKAQSDEVKQFGQHMVDDHGKLLEDVQKLAQDKGVDLPDQPSAKHQAAIKKLQGTPEAKFDQAYMQEMVKDHRADVRELQKLASNAKDPDVKAAAREALPKVRDHLKMAQETVGKTGGSASRGSSASRGKAKD